MITAGPTREPLDPVRYISNHSSGKMGFTVAAAAARRGANVTLVSGPVSLPTPPFINRVGVMTAGNGSRRKCFSTAAKYFIRFAPPWHDYQHQLPWPQKKSKAGHAG